MMRERLSSKKRSKEQATGKDKSQRMSDSKKSHTDKRIFQGKAAQPPAKMEWQHLLILGIIVLYAAIVSAQLYSQQKESPFSRHPVTDEEAYITQAQGILEGTYPGKKIFYQSPLYPYVLAGTFYLFGEDYNIIRMIQFIFGLASIIFIYFLVRFIFGVCEGLIAATLLALYGPILNYQILLLKVSPFLVLLSLFLLVGTLLTQNPRGWWRWLVLGILCSLLLLLRDNAQIFLVIVPIWVIFQFRYYSWKMRLSFIILFILGAALVVGPLIARNKIVAGELVISTSQGGANFFIGNNPIADGRYKTLPFVRPHPATEQTDFKAEAEKRAGHSLRDTEISGFWYRQGFLFIKNHPRQWIRLLWKKTRFFFGNFEIPDNHGYSFDRAHFLSALYFTPLSFGIIFPLAIFGMAITWRRWQSLSFLYLIFVFYSLTILAFFVVGRYRVPIVITLIPFAAAGVSKFWDYTKHRDIASIFSAFALIFAVALFSYFPTEASQASWATEYFLLGNAYLKDADEYYTAGNMDLGKSNAELAMKHFKRSLQLNPRNDNARQSMRYAYKLLGIEPPPEAITQPIPERPPPDLISPGVLPIDEEAHTNPIVKARALTLEGRYEQALQTLKKAIEKDPEDAQMYFELGLLLASKEQIRNFAEATMFLKKALEIDPKHADAWNVLGNIAYINGNMEEARSHYLRALTLVPDSPAYKNNLAMTYQKELKPPGPPKEP